MLDFAKELTLRTAQRAHLVPGAIVRAAASKMLDPRSSDAQRRSDAQTFPIFLGLLGRPGREIQARQRFLARCKALGASDQAMSKSELRPRSPRSAKSRSGHGLPRMACAWRAHGVRMACAWRVLQCASPVRSRSRAV